MIRRALTWAPDEDWAPWRCYGGDGGGGGGGEGGGGGPGGGSDSGFGASTGGTFGTAGESGAPGSSAFGAEGGGGGASFGASTGGAGFGVSAEAAAAAAAAFDAANGLGAFAGAPAADSGFGTFGGAPSASAGLGDIGTADEAGGGRGDVGGGRGGGFSQADASGVFGALSGGLAAANEAMAAANNAAFEGVGTAGVGYGQAGVGSQGFGTGTFGAPAGATGGPFGGFSEDDGGGKGGVAGPAGPDDDSTPAGAAPAEGKGDVSDFAGPDDSVAGPDDDYAGPLAGPDVVGDRGALVSERGPDYEAPAISPMDPALGGRSGVFGAPDETMGRGGRDAADPFADPFDTSQPANSLFGNISPAAPAFDVFGPTGVFGRSADIAFSTPFSNVDPFSLDARDIANQPPAYAPNFNEVFSNPIANPTAVDPFADRFGDLPPAQTVDPFADRFGDLPPAQPAVDPFADRFGAPWDDPYQAVDMPNRGPTAFESRAPADIYDPSLYAPTVPTPNPNPLNPAERGIPSQPPPMTIVGPPVTDFPFNRGIEAPPPAPVVDPGRVGPPGIEVLSNPNPTYPPGSRDFTTGGRTGTFEPPGPPPGPPPAPPANRGTVADDVISPNDLPIGILDRSPVTDFPFTRGPEPVTTPDRAPTQITVGGTPTPAVQEAGKAAQANPALAAQVAQAAPAQVAAIAQSLGVDYPTAAMILLMQIQQQQQQQGQEPKPLPPDAAPLSLAGMM